MDFKDTVEQPSHYTNGDIECIDAIREALGEEGFKYYCRGCVIKYAWRAGSKDGEPAEKDMAKAAIYSRWASQ